MIDLLENILVPGRRARISPYVQDAQLDILFGSVPDAQNRHDSIRSILNNNEAELQKLANTYIKFADSGRNFDPKSYLTPEFLELYLSYYFTTNVSKIQLCLLDLARTKKISGDLKVIDIGVGAGTTAVAVLDFMLAFATAAHLTGAPFPVVSLSIECHDISQVCLDMAKKSVNAFCDAVERRKKSVYDQKEMTASMDSVISWGRSAKWINSDINQSQLQQTDQARVLLFASNILSELSDSGRAILASSFANMPHGSIATIIEPGDEGKCKKLNNWKVGVQSQYKDISTLFPCGVTLTADSTSCKSCWNSRRESLHEPLLYKSLRDRTGDPRGFDEYSNNLLSWSYVCLERSNTNCFFNETNSNTTEIRTHVMGMIRRKSNDSEWQPAAFAPDENSEPGIREFIKLCPIGTSNTGVRVLWARREPGFVLPHLTHGAVVTIAGGELQKTAKESVWVVPFNQSVQVKTYLPQLTRREFLKSYTESSKEAIDEIAFRLFGFKSMRPFQHEILSRVLSGKSILGIAATGGGKSECYILPAMLFSGVTIVVSPLKSLMQDQFEKRIDERYGLKNLATFINGDVPFKERQVRLKRLEMGYYKIAYFTPEQLRQSHVLNALKRAHDCVFIRYLALDEAHCISQWGHDFRDSYLNLVSRLNANGIDPVRIALTATASPEVRVDLCEELNLKNEPLESGGDVYVHSSNRVELNLIVKTVRNTEEKTKDIIERLQTFLLDNHHSTNPDAAIVFMPLTGSDPNTPNWYLPGPEESSGKGRSSAGVSNFASYLERSLEKRVAIYHGKMDFDGDDSKSQAVSASDQPQLLDQPLEDKLLGDLSGRSRKSEQTAFIDGKHPIMVATKGFGMGIDKPNIRLIIHRSPTVNLEAYAQEAGRAGRDGQISDVVLYYSPDSTEESGAVRSDYKIQDFFLSQKYIRREDVVAMRKFLATVDREVCGHLYFTSDEIIPFFDELGDYTWPKFQARLKKETESREHSVILDRGYEYAEKIRYIDRILSVLYRIRPDIGTNRRVCMIASVQETGAVLITGSSANSVLNAEAIVNSNTYFGELFRSKNINSSSLKDWISKCVTKDSIEFARYLGLSVAETASILWDINRSDGELRNGKWKSALLDFMFIATPGYGVTQELKTFPEIRDYKGASSRANYAEARRRSLDAVRVGQDRQKNYKGEIVPNENDWFGWRELPQSKGWEIVPGDALRDTVQFEAYIESFMELHDRRQANDRAAYNLLLTDYVGVNEDGTLPDNNDNKPCLRAVLLGYLKTGEVVLGNCRSCSRCAPHGNFETDIAKRSQIVEQLGTEIIDLLNSLEKFNSEVPFEGGLATLWEHVLKEEASGRSLGAYVEGWAGRILTDSPGHMTAGWIRVDGMARGVLQLQPKEACSRALELVEKASEEALPLLWESISKFKLVMPDLPEALLVQAKICQRMGLAGEAQSLWTELLSHPLNRTMQYAAHSSLCKLTAADGPLQNSDSFVTHGFSAARTAPDFKASESYYTKIRQGWLWEEIQPEIIWHQEQASTTGNDQRLLDWWLHSQSKITLIASSTPDHWQPTIDYVVSLIDSEYSNKSTVADMLLNTIVKLTDSILQNAPPTLPVHALRIAISASRNTTTLINLESEIFAFIKERNLEALLWLSDLIESHRLSSEHYMSQLVLAECAYLQEDYTSADNCWRSYIENPPSIAAGFAIDHVFARLINLHAPSSVLPDSDCYQATLSAKIARAETWDEAKEIYKLKWPSIQMDALIRRSACPLAQLMVELNKIENRGVLWQLGLIELWSSYQVEIVGANDLLDFLSSLPEKVRESNFSSISTILKKMPPFEIASNRVIGLDWLQVAKKTPGFDEFLICSTLTGLIDYEEAKQLNIGRIIFYAAEDNVAAHYSSLYAANCRNDVIAGKTNYFFDGYAPGTAKALEKWLQWFGELIGDSERAAARTGEVIDFILQRDPSKVHMDNFMSTCFNHKIWHLSKLFPRIFFEYCSDNTAAQYLENIAPGCQEEVIAGKLNHCFHSYNPETIKGLKRWLNWFGGLKDHSADIANRIGAVIENILRLGQSREALGQIVSLSEEYKIETASELLIVIKTTVDIVRSVEQATSIHQMIEIDKTNLAALIGAMPRTQDEIQSDVYVSILKAIKLRINPHWKTPLVRLVEALVNSGRISEALELGDDPELRYGKSRVSLNEYVGQFKGEQRTFSNYESVIDNIVNSHVMDWRFTNPRQSRPI